MNKIDKILLAVMFSSLIGLTYTSLVMVSQKNQQLHDLEVTLITERIEHLRLKAAMDYLHIDDIVAKPDNSGVEIKWNHNK